jgi:hypothetical protein
MGFYGMMNADRESGFDYKDYTENDFGWQIHAKTKNFN